MTVRDHSPAIDDVIGHRSPVIAILLLVGFLLMTFQTDARAVAPPADFFGIGSMGQLGDEYEQEEIQRLGTHIVRNNFVWENVQKETCEANPKLLPEEIKFYDARVRRAAYRNVTILADLYGTRSQCDVHPFPTPGTKVYEEYTQKDGFVWKIVQRYGVNGKFWQEYPDAPVRPIRIWEVWNEPNLSENNPEWTLHKTNAQRYAQLLIATAKTIRDAQEAQAEQSVAATGTKVLMGGLVTVEGAKDINEYFKWIYDNPSYSISEFKNSFDGLSFHPYAIGGLPGHAKARITNARTVLDNYGLADKTLWITEFGWPVGTFKGDLGTDNVTEEEQSEYLADTMNWIYGEADAKQIQYAAIYVYRDTSNSFCTLWSCWAGLKDFSGKDRAAWCMVQITVTGACAPPHPSKWPSDNLGGWIIGDPAISSSGTNKLELFARGVDGALWHRNWNGASWSDWVSLGGALASGSGPGTVSWNGNRVDVVYRGTDNGVWQRAWGEGSNGGVPVSLGGYTLSDPAISSKGKGQLQVFVRGADNALWTKSFSSGSWSGWETLGGQITSGPGAVSWDSGRTDVVARGTDNGVWHWYWDGSWHLESIGGSVASDPTISTLGSGTLDVFARGWDNALWHQSFHNNNWWGWESLGTIVTSGPSSVSWGDQRTDVVARTDDLSVQHSWWSP